MIGVRILQLIPIMFLVSALAFALSHASSGDVATVTLQSRGIQVTEKTLAAVKSELGLDKPLPEQYLDWVGRAVRLDFGTSFQTHQPVSDEIFSRFPATVELAVVATLLSVVIAVPVALLCARYKDGPIDAVARVLSSVGTTIPNFCVGILLLYAFAVNMHVFPVVSGTDPVGLVLPSVTLAVFEAATYSRVLRGDLLAAAREDYVLASRARGLTRGTALVRHALRNAILPTLTLVGFNFGQLLGGQMAIETIFSWNGIGMFAIQSMKQKDLPVIEGYIVIVSITFVLVSLLLDIIYLLIDPRIDRKQEEA